MAKKTTKEKGSEKLSNPKWELFAYLYSGHHNARLFGNGTQCYSLAYGYDEKIEKIQAEIEDLQSKAAAGYSVKVKALEAAVRRIRTLCSVEGSRLLVKPSVTERCDYLLSTYISNDFADRELAYVIAQRVDLPSKVAAIKEQNRVKSRVAQKLEGDFRFEWGGEEE